MEKIDKIQKKNFYINRKNIDLNRNIISIILLIGYVIFAAIYLV